MRLLKTRARGARAKASLQLYPELEGLKVEELAWVLGAPGDLGGLKPENAEKPWVDLRWTLRKGVLSLPAGWGRALRSSEQQQPFTGWCIAIIQPDSQMKCLQMPWKWSFPSQARFPLGISERRLDLCYSVFSGIVMPINCNIG